MGLLSEIRVLRIKGTYKGAGNFPLKLTLQRKGDSSIRNRVPWQISSNGKCRKNTQSSYKLVTFKWIAAVSVYMHCTY